MYIKYHNIVYEIIKRLTLYSDTSLYIVAYKLTGVVYKYL